VDDRRDRRAGPRLRSDRGSATVWSLAVLGLLWAAGLAALLVVSAVAARHSAAAAADMAALAAADRLAVGLPDACASAARVAGMHAGRLTHCAIEGDAVEVYVEIKLRGMLTRFGAVEGRARAGPS
jgi:secretion/DNA translocation related TadE-like protein